MPAVLKWRGDCRRRIAYPNHMEFFLKNRHHHLCHHLCPLSCPICHVFQGSDMTLMRTCSGNVPKHPDLRSENPFPSGICSPESLLLKSSSANSYMNLSLRNSRCSHHASLIRLGLRMGNDRLSWKVVLKWGYQSPGGTGLSQTSQICLAGMARTWYDLL